MMVLTYSRILSTIEEALQDLVEEYQDIGKFLQDLVESWERNTAQLARIRAVVDAIQDLKENSQNSNEEDKKEYGENEEDDDNGEDGDKEGSKEGLEENQRKVLEETPLSAFCQNFGFVFCFLNTTEYYK